MCGAPSIRAVSRIRRKFCPFACAASGQVRRPGGPMLDTLSAALDAAIVSEDTDAFTLHGVKPGAVVEPHNADDAAAVMRLATQNNWRVECAGSGTQAVGNRRTRVDIVI